MIEYESFTLAPAPPQAARLAPPDAGRTARLTVPVVPVPAPPAPLAPAADPAYRAVLIPGERYYAALLRPATGARDEGAGAGCPPGWAWATPAEYEGWAGHIRVAALKITVEAGLLDRLPAAGWLAVRWAGYDSPTFFCNHAWLAARVAALDRYARPQGGNR